MAARFVFLHFFLVPLSWYAVSERQTLLFFAGGLVGVDKHVFQTAVRQTQTADWQREKKTPRLPILYPFRMPRERFYQKLGLDLVQATQNELDFLKQVDECPSLYKSSALKNAIRRYEVFWLPLAAREGYGSRFLAAPLDIAWVWHVHMLSPYNYEQDCLNCVSKIVDHVPLGDLERKRCLEKARCLWEREYPDEPFEVDFLSEQTHQLKAPGVKNTVKPVEAVTLWECLTDRFRLTGK